MRIGLFGGSFDPVHWGHLLHAQDVMEQASLDRLVFVPAAQAPLKSTGDPGANAKQRLQMLELSIEQRVEFSVLSDELDRGGVSYTVDTIRRLKERWPEDDLFWLVGADQVGQLDQWREIESLLSMVTFLCMRRPGYPAEAPSSIPGSALQWVSGRELEISSTEIRERVKAGKPIDFFLPPVVVSFIRENHLYC